MLIPGALLAGALFAAGAPADAATPRRRSRMPLPAAAADRMNGEWEGRYHYPDGSKTRPPVEFLAVLRQSGDRFEGVVTEPATFGDGSSPVLRASVRGDLRKDGVVRFTKTYDGTGGVSHSVEYLGYASMDGRSVSGMWKAPGDYSGTFEMVRGPAPWKADAPGPAATPAPARRIPR